MNSKPKIPQMRKSLILMALGLLVFFIVMKFFVDYKDILAVMLDISPVFIILMVVSKAASLLIYNYKAYILGRRIFKISFWKMLPIHMAGAMMNNLTPGPSVGGEPLKAYYLEKETGKRGSICLGLYAMDSGMFLIATAIFMFFSTFYLIGSIKFIRLKYFLIGWLVFGLIITILALVFVFKFSKNKKILGKILKLIYKIPFLTILKRYFKTPEAFVEEIYEKRRAFIETMKELWVDKKTLCKNVFWSILWYPLQGLGLWLLFAGLHQPVSFLMLVAVTTVSMSLGFVVFLPGGSGIYEMAVILLMSLLGVATTTITATLIIDRAAYYIMTYVIGYFCLSYIAMKYSQKAKTK